MPPVTVRCRSLTEFCNVWTTVSLRRTFKMYTAVVVYRYGFIENVWITCRKPLVLL